MSSVPPPEPVPAGPGAPPPAESAGPGVPPPHLVRSPLSDGEWHRLHPLTPLLRGGLFLIVVIGIVLANLRDRLVFVFLPWLAPDIESEVGEWEGAGGDPIDFIIANNLYVMAGLAVLAVLIVVVAVPYGRMQLIDITHGPLDRGFGIAQLKFVTAAAATGVTIPGLEQSTAETLRDHLVQVAESRRTGL